MTNSARFSLSRFTAATKSNFIGCLPILLFLFASVTSAQEPVASQRPKDSAPVANFVDIAEKAGLTAVTVFGGVDTKKYIIETTGASITAELQSCWRMEDGACFSAM